MKARVLLTILAAITILSIAGCSSDNNERQSIVCEVKSINLHAPIISTAVDLANISDPLDDFVPIDSFPFEFVARTFLSGSITDPDGPSGYFHITGFDLTWTPQAGAPAEISTYNQAGGALDLIVPLDESVLASIIVVPPAMKDEAWYPAQYSNTTYTALLRVNFKGHASGSEHEVIVPASATVTFLGQASLAN